MNTKLIFPFPVLAAPCWNTLRSTPCRGAGCVIDFAIVIVISIVIIISVIFFTIMIFQEWERHITLLHDHRLDDVELGGG